MQPQNDLLNIRGPNLIKFRLPKSTGAGMRLSTMERTHFSDWYLVSNVSLVISASQSFSNSIVRQALKE